MHGAKTDPTYAARIDATNYALANDDGEVISRAAHIFCYIGRQYDRASSLIEHAAALNPNDARILLRRGWIALMCNEPERAIESFEQYLALNPIDPRRGVSWNGMAFAYFIAHAGRDFFPLLNGGTLAALFCFVYFYLAFVGPGPWSIDAWRDARRNRLDR